uniref:Uncharacterized protein n=1 Tax=Ditylum brightwellii TaxID=49249 RepID=A0A7S1VZG6_9STRA
MMMTNSSGNNEVQQQRVKCQNKPLRTKGENETSNNVNVATEESSYFSSSVETATTTSMLSSAMSTPSLPPSSTPRTANSKHHHQQKNQQQQKQSTSPESNRPWWQPQFHSQRSLASLPPAPQQQQQQQLGSNELALASLLGLGPSSPSIALSSSSDDDDDDDKMFPQIDYSMKPYETYAYLMEILRPPPSPPSSPSKSSPVLDDRFRRPPPKVIYFNNAGASPSPKSVIRSMTAHFALEMTRGGYHASNLMKKQSDLVYKYIAQLIHATDFDCEEENGKVGSGMQQTSDNVDDNSRYRREIALVESATVGWTRIFYSMAEYKSSKVFWEEEEEERQLQRRRKLDEGGRDGHGNNRENQDEANFKALTPPPTIANMNQSVRAMSTRGGGVTQTRTDDSSDVYAMPSQDNLDKSVDKWHLSSTPLNSIPSSTTIASNATTATATAHVAGGLVYATAETIDVPKMKNRYILVSEVSQFSRKR